MYGYADANTFADEIYRYTLIILIIKNRIKTTKKSLENMKKIFLLTMVAVVFLLSVTSCQKEEKKANITIKATTENTEVDFTEFDITINNLRTLTKIDAKLDQNGEYQGQVDVGTYTITINWRDGNVSLFGSKESLSIVEDVVIDIPLTFSIGKPDGLIFKEVFHNGETNNGQMMHPDQFFVLVNNGTSTVYADGVCFAVARHPNFAEADDFTNYLPDAVIAGLVYAIPGNGTSYPLAPGEELVIARTAINHNETYENAVDLSGAHFEAFDATASDDVDNPNVPNLIAYYSMFGEFMMHPRGYLPPFIFRVEDNNIQQYLEENKIQFVDSEGEVEYGYKINTDLILDGIETGNQGQLAVKSLPNSVDKGTVQVTGCHRQMLVVRKYVVEDGVKHYIDTDNSSEDCEIQIGANSYPRR